MNSESIKGDLSQQVSYSGFEPKFSYSMKGINVHEAYDGNAAEVALAYCERNSVLLSIEDDDRLYAEFDDNDKKFIVNLKSVYARDLVSALAAFFYCYILTLSNEYVIKEFEV